MVDRVFIAKKVRCFRCFLAPGTVFSLVLIACVLNTSSLALAQSRSEAEMSMRIGALEEQIRSMTGQFERMNYEINQLNERLRRFSEDTEYRFQEMGSGTGGRRSEYQAPAGPPPPPQPTYSGATINQTPNRSSATVGSPPAPLGTLSTNSDPAGPLNINPGSRFGQPAQNFADPNASIGPSFSNPITGGTGNVGLNPGQVAIGVPMDSRTEYDVAYSYILQRDYEAAEAAFSTFLVSYPGDNLTGNAQYWLGESYYARGLYRPAADAFLKGYSGNKRSQKAPDSLLKLGMSLLQLGQKGAACSTFAELTNKHPNASPNIRQRAARESERARC